MAFEFVLAAHYGRQAQKARKKNAHREPTNVRRIPYPHFAFRNPAAVQDPCENRHVSKTSLSERPCSSRTELRSARRLLCHGQKLRGAQAHIGFLSSSPSWASRAVV